MPCIFEEFNCDPDVGVISGRTDRDDIISGTINHKGQF